MNRQEEYQIKKAEKSRLLSEIKALEKKRMTLTDPTEQEQAKAQIRELRAQHDAVHQQVEELKRWFQWDGCARREIACAGDE